MIEYNSIPESNQDCSVALGCFDGIHKGHLSVIEAAVKCKEQGLAPSVFTFANNPLKVLRGKTIPRLITHEQKINILKKSGIEILYNIPFETVMHLSEEDFVKKILIDSLKAKKIYCGFNFTFGKGGNGNIHSLERLCRKYGSEAYVVPALYYKDLPISSTRIRKALEDGNVKEANTMLGRLFSLKLEIQPGNRIGRKLGFPTLNQPLPYGFIRPKYGVYASAAYIEGKYLCGVTNIGVKPTVGSEIPLAETWIPNCKLSELYGKTVEIFILDFIRAEKKFESLDRLREAVIADSKTAEIIFANDFKK